MIQIEQSKDLFLLKKEEARADAKLAKEATPINPDSKKIIDTYEKVNNSYDKLKFATEDVHVLIFGLGQKDSASQCCGALDRLLSYHPDLFQEKHVDALFAGFQNKDSAGYFASTLGNLADSRADLFQEKHVYTLSINLLQNKYKDVARNCAAALTWLTHKKSDLFQEKHVEVLVAGLQNQKEDISHYCAAALTWLASNNPGLFQEKYVEALIAGLQNKNSALGCAEALKYLISTAPLARAHLLSLFDRLSPEAKQLLASSNITKFVLENVDRLQKEFNITCFTRYPAPVLKDMLEGERNFQKPLAVVAYPKVDRNSAFYHNRIDQLFAAGYHVVVFESEDEDEFVQMMTKVKKKSGFASLLVIGGHGSPTSIQLGNGYFEGAKLDTGDEDILEKIKFAMTSSFMKPQIIMESCSTGNKQTTDNMAKTTSDYNDRIQVFAPDQPTSISNIEFDYVQRGPRKLPIIKRVIYADENIETQYQKGQLAK